jgi:cellobiose-specific phosphotransferase system component IIA
MKKIITIAFVLTVVPLLVFSQTTTTIPSATPTPQTAKSTTPKPKQVNLDCMKNAVEKRENALKTARETYFNKINQAYDERKTALLNAWTIGNQKERQKAVRVAWDNFRNSVKSAKSEYKKAHNQAWNTFVKDRKACKFGPTGENPEADLNY